MAQSFRLRFLMPLSTFNDYKIPGVSGYSPPLWATGVVYVSRAVIQRAPTDLLSKPSVQGVARAMAAALARKWEVYNVVGVTIVKPQIGTSISTGLLSSNIISGTDTYIVDCVFILREMNIKKPMGVTDNDLALEIRNKLTEQRLNFTIVTVLGTAAYDDAVLGPFWTRDPLFEWNGKEAQPTTLFEAGLHGKGFGADGVSFSQGVSTDIQYLLPFPSTVWDSGTGPGPGPNPDPDKGLGTKLFPTKTGSFLGDVTVAHVAITGLFALVGWKLHGLFTKGSQ
jgi:hypothetical protein